MPSFIESPTVVAGVEPKLIEEYVGAINTSTDELSVARMVAPAYWSEPGQRPTFDEVTVVLDGMLIAEFENETLRVGSGQCLVAKAGEWVRYSTARDGATYIAVCTPAFTPESVNRDS